MATRKMHILLWLQNLGHNLAAWRHPDSRTQDFLTVDYLRDVGSLAESGKLDMVFIEDVMFTRESGGRYFGEVSINSMDPSIIIAALSSVTEKIGLAATYSTTYHEPEVLARKFATLDHLSKGRLAWNVVTSDPRVARNFGATLHPDKELRYRKAADTIAAIKALFDSWRDDALVFDQAGGRFYDPERVRPVAHNGEFVRVQDALGVPRSPQGHPVFIQAGMSEWGLDFAASFAEAVFASAKSLELARDYRTALKQKVADKGRDPDGIKIFPGFVPIVGSTEEEARRKEAYFDSLVHPRAMLNLLREQFHLDFSQHSLDDPFPVETIMASDGYTNGRTQVPHYLKAIRGQESMATYCRRHMRSLGHQYIVGTPEQVADFMQGFVDGGGCDGFVLAPSHIPGELKTFIEEVVPVLQKRGAFRQDYEGTTLRDHLGLSRPAS